MSTAFISYSWEDEEHNNTVTKLAAVLINNDIMTGVDTFDISPGSNLEKFMNEGVSKSKFIIPIISDGYLEKINRIGTGVSKEMKLIEKYIDNALVIPVLLNNTNGVLPKIFDGLFYVNIDQNGFEQSVIDIAGCITGQVKKRKPIQGTKMFINQDAHRWITNNELKKSTYISPSMTGIAKFNYSNNSGKFVIGTGDYAFDTKWSKASDVRIHAYSDGANIRCIGIIKSSEIEYEEIDFDSVDFTSRVRHPSVGDVVIWLNQKDYVAMTRIISIQDDTRGSSEDELIFEYEIKYTYS